MSDEIVSKPGFLCPATCVLAVVFKNKTPVTTVRSEPRTVIDVLLKARDGALNLYP